MQTESRDPPLHQSAIVVTAHSCNYHHTNTTGAMDIDATPNGSAGPSTSPFANLTLAVDSYTLDAAAGKRRLKQIEEDGSLTFEEP